MRDPIAETIEKTRNSDIEQRTFATLALLLIHTEADVQREFEEAGAADPSIAEWSERFRDEIGAFAQALIAGHADESTRHVVRIMAILTRMTEKAHRP